MALAVTAPVTVEEGHLTVIKHQESVIVAAVRKVIQGKHVNKLVGLSYKIILILQDDHWSFFKVNIFFFNVVIYSP